jgi:hypothetical protein
LGRQLRKHLCRLSPRRLRRNVSAEHGVTRRGCDVGNDRGAALGHVGRYVVRTNVSTK